MNKSIKEIIDKAHKQMKEVDLKSCGCMLRNGLYTYLCNEHLNDTVVELKNEQKRQSDYKKGVRQQSAKCYPFRRKSR